MSLVATHADVWHASNPSYPTRGGLRLTHADANAPAQSPSATRPDATGSAQGDEGGSRRPERQPGAEGRNHDRGRTATRERARNGAGRTHPPVLLTAPPAGGIVTLHPRRS